jgi:hypothetical protein
MVFDLSGAHRLVVRYCHCHRHIPKHIQLLRARWFPATLERPSTVFAFDILDFFHKLQNNSKCNSYDFYNAILQRADAAGLNPEIVCFFFSASVSLPLTADPQYRYNELTFVYRLWVHLHILKRGGAFYASPTVEQLFGGSMAVSCPACPQPGRNTLTLPRSESYE